MSLISVPITVFFAKILLLTYIVVFMKAIILNASAWMIVPVMDAFAKHFNSSMDVLQITWARYFFTVVFTLSNMLLFIEIPLFGAKSLHCS